MSSPRYRLLIALAASLLAAGCCSGPLSGRYCDPSCCARPRASQCCCPICIATRQPAPAPCLPAECQPAIDPTISGDNPGEIAVCPDSEPCPDPPKPRFASCGRWHAWFAGFRHGVPSQQHPDYYSPPAKFHPIPTRPAFEPLPSYPPLLPADPGMNNPLRASTDRPSQPAVR
jgi:hypothetical protein